jgi:hypothetical protein
MKRNVAEDAMGRIDEKENAVRLRAGVLPAARLTRLFEAR